MNSTTVTQSATHSIYRASRGDMSDTVSQHATTPVAQAANEAEDIVEQAPSQTRSKFPPHHHRPGWSECNTCYCFNQKPSQATLDRCNNALTKIQPRLTEFVSKFRRKRHLYRHVDNISLGVTCRSLGRVDASAKVLIVMICAEHIRGKIQRWIDKGSLDEICQPERADIMKLGIVLVDGALIEEATGSLLPSQIYCSPGFSQGADRYYRTALIKAEEENRRHYATMGGLLTIVGADGGASILGLTASHLFLHREKENDNDEGFATRDSDSSDSESDIESPDMNESGGESHQTPDTSSLEAIEADDLENRDWFNLGALADVSYSQQAKDRDWALVELLDQAETRQIIPELINKDMISAETEERPADRVRIVCLSGQVSCDLSSWPAMALLRNGRSFVRAYITTSLNSQGMISIPLPSHSSNTQQIFLPAALDLG
ncbi:uncharacterized protein EKO05_0003163 [Ascochyta rabiei]|uniref:uncharacterized protein n=1 Tax=Didymella rabiei TaxID=5454 RepID=UPI0022020A98|nr:uncharacterized protein EKO05_0003163 [Ascochyta rabiei]UPX12622.1 hypothetical protein EKO05_0003163 [Ascochyta rabiei]